MTPPTLILLPGLHGTADLFPPLLSIIPKHVSVRAIAYPTHRCLTQKSLLRYLEQQLQNESDMLILAESFSGPLALRFANQNPTRIRALILCCTFIAPPVPRILCYLAGIPILLHCPIPTFAIRAFLAGFRAPHALVRETRRAIRANSPLALTYRVQQAAGINVRAALKSCTVPILCLAATRDRLMGRRAVRGIRRARADIPIHFIDAPHLLLQLKPAQAWRKIASFPPVANCLGLAPIPA